MKTNRRLVVALLFCTLFSSCFTMALWGFYPDSEHDDLTGKDESTFSYDEETKWSWGLFGLRVLATPATLALDCLTCPVQAWLWADGDDDAKCRH